MFCKLVLDKAENNGSVTVEEVKNDYLVLQVWPGGKHLGVQSGTKNLVQRMGQRLTRLWAADRICMAYVEREPDRVTTFATSWPRGLPRFPHSPTQPLGYDQYRLLGHSVLDPSLTRRQTRQTNRNGKWMLLWGGEQIGMPTDRKQQRATCADEYGN